MNEFLRAVSMLSSATIGLLLGLWLVGLAQAHDAPSGWQYPAHCCHNADCAPADKVKFIDGEDKGATKLHKEITLNPRKYNHVLPSPDNNIHVCATPDNQSSMGGRTYYCIFYPAGS